MTPAVAVRRVAPAAAAVALAATPGCSDEKYDAPEPTGPERIASVPNPCRVLPPAEVARVLEEDVTGVHAAPSPDTPRTAVCTYRLGTRAEFLRLLLADSDTYLAHYEAERRAFTDRGILLAPPEPVAGLGDEAFIDVRYDQLYVRSGNYLISFDLSYVAGQDGDLPEQKALARSAIESLRDR